jgi:opacity protein-like surface antigen
MMRYARAVIVCVVGSCCAASASAQTQPPAPIDFPGYAALTFGATLGHKSDKSVGGEVGYRATTAVDVFFEGGHIGNAATSTFENKGQTIGNSVGASVSAVEKVNFFDVGIRYRLPMVVSRRVRPYVAFGVGMAQVKNQTVFSVNGTAMDAEALGIQTGTDLNGTLSKPFVMIGVGGDVRLTHRFFADVSYRYGRVSAEKSDGDVVLAAVNTNRVQVGVGIRF